MAEAPLFSEALPDLATLRLNNEIEVTARILASVQDCIKSGVKFEGFELALRMGLGFLEHERESVGTDHVEP